MKKDLFIGGQVYDLATTTAKEIQDDFQKRINELYGVSNRVLTQVQIEGNVAKVNILRRYVKDVEDILPYNTFFNNEHNIFCLDSDLPLGRGFKDTMLVEEPGGVGFGYYYSWPFSEFEELYKQNCRLLKASKPKKMDFVGSETSITFTFTY